MTDTNTDHGGAEYRKTATIRAVQWFKMGDHPAVIPKPAMNRDGPVGVPWVRTLEGGHVVTPGDWIATGVQGEHWPIKPDVFAATYAPVAHPTPQTDTDAREKVVEAPNEEDEEWSESPLANAIYAHVQSQFCLHPDEAAEEAGAILQLLKDAGPDAILAALKTGDA